MRRCAKPSIDSGAVYDACVSEVTDTALAAQFVAARTSVLASYVEYETLAAGNALFQLQASNWGNGAQVLHGDITKKQLMDVSSYYHNILVLITSH